MLSSPTRTMDVASVATRCKKAGCTYRLVRVEYDGSETCVAGHRVYPNALPTSVARRFADTKNVGHNISAGMQRRRGRWNWRA